MSQPLFPRTALTHAATLALAIAVQPARAETAVTTDTASKTLAPVTVTGSSAPETATGPVDGYVARRSSTATKTDTPLNEVPQSVSVITADQLSDQGSQDMQQALRYTAGVRNEMYGIDNRGDWFTLRGGSEGSVLLNGLRLPLPNGSGNLRNEPYAFERIEVLRGPASVVAGQNGPGGVVNLVSKRPQAEAVHEIGMQLGSYGHQQLNADLTGPLNADGSLLYRLVALGRDTGTQVDHADEERTLLAPSLTWKPQAGTALTLYAEYQKDRNGTTNAFFGKAGTLSAAPNGAIPLSTFISEPAWDRNGGTRKRFGWELEQQLSSDWTLRQHLRHDTLQGGQRSLYANWWDGYADATGAPDANGTYLNRTWYGGDTRFQSTNADLLLEGKLGSGRVQHRLLAGMDSLRTRETYTNASGSATPLDVYNPVYGSFGEPSMADASTTQAEVRNFGLLLQDQIKFDQRWVLVAGLRSDQARSTTNGVARKDHALSKNLGLVWLADGGWSPYASYAESFEPVAGSTAAGSSFVPKRGKQVEAGVKWQPADQRLSASASVYRLVEKNRTVTDPSDLTYQVQRGEVTVKGLELEAAAHLPAWDLIAQYSHTDAQITSTSSAETRYLDQQLQSLPRDSASLWALHKLAAWGLPGVRVGLGARYAGRNWDGVGGSSVPPVTLFDALVGYDTGPWRMALNVNNLADKTYIATCLERGDCWFGSRRKAVLTVAYRW